MERVPGYTGPVSGPTSVAWWRRWHLIVRWLAVLLILVLLRVSGGLTWSAAFSSSLGFALAVAAGTILFYLGERLLSSMFRRRPDQEVLRAPPQE